MRRLFWLRTVREVGGLALRLCLSEVMLWSRDDGSQQPEDESFRDNDEPFPFINASDLIECFSSEEYREVYIC